MYPNKFDRSITLIKPGAITQDSASGEEVVGDEVEFKIKAFWEEVSATDNVTANAKFNSEISNIVFHWDRKYADIHSGWHFVVESGVKYKITSVQEDGGRRKFIKCVGISNQG